MNKVRKSLATVACVALGWMLASPSALAQDKHGNAFGEWAAAWWTWTLATPVLLPSGSHPAFDVGNVDCSIGQDGHVWFLQGSFAFDQIQRGCSVPTGTGFVFPLYNAVWVNYASDPPLTPEFCAEILRINIESLGATTFTALLDGKPLKKNAIQFEQSPIFAVQMVEPTATETNLLVYLGFPEAEFPGGVATANCDSGWYGYVEPLSVGQHVLEWKFDSSTLGSLSDVRYDLTVIPRQK